MPSALCPKPVPDGWQTAGKTTGWMSASQTVVLLSYVPLLSGTAGEALSGRRRQEVFRGLKQSPAVRGLLWLREDDDVVPVFLLERAREVAEHLKSWAEGSPQHWFYLYIARTAQRWHVMLAPNLQRSISRYREARWLRFGEVAPEDAKFQLVYQPLYWSHGLDVVKGLEVRA